MLRTSAFAKIDERAPWTGIENLARINGFHLYRELLGVKVSWIGLSDRCAFRKPSRRIAPLAGVCGPSTLCPGQDVAMRLGPFASIARLGLGTPTCGRQHRLGYPRLYHH